MPSRHLLVFSIYMGLASSASNHTVINGWVSEPSNSRGTFTILSSCITTLILCVYTAVHLNVPHHGDAEFRRWLRTTKWVILGILAPELVVFVAWRQYVSAVTLERAVKQIQTNGEILEDAISTGRYIPKVLSCFNSMECLKFLMSNRTERILVLSPQTLYTTLGRGSMPSMPTWAALLLISTRLT